MRNQISEAQKIASGGGSEQDIAEAKIELEVCWRVICSILLYISVADMIRQVLESLQASLK